MVHENLQTDVVCEDRSSGLLAPGVEVVVGLGGVDFGEEEAGL